MPARRPRTVNDVSTYFVTSPSTTVTSDSGSPKTTVRDAATNRILSRCRRLHGQSPWPRPLLHDGVPRMTCHSTSAHLTIVAVVATQRRTAGHGPAHRPLSSLLAERPYSLVEPAPLDDGRLVRPLETLSKSGILQFLSAKRLLMPSVSHCLSNLCQWPMFGRGKSRFSKFE